jgi:hypothetical protein
MHPSTEAILRYFAYLHLPVHLQEVSKPFFQLAHVMADDLEGPELAAGLRKLLEAKDCMVRAALEPSFRDRVHSNITGKGPS